MAFEHYNSIPGQWLDTCQAAAGLGRAGPGGRRVWPGVKVTTGEEPGGAEASGERHAPPAGGNVVFRIIQFLCFFGVL